MSNLSTLLITYYSHDLIFQWLLLGQLCRFFPIPPPTCIQTGCRPEPTGGSFVPLAPLNDSVFVPPTDASTPIQVDPEVTTPKTIIKDFVSVDMDENNNVNNDKPVVDDGGVLRPIHPLQPTMFFASTPASATATMTDAHKRAKDDNEANPNYGDLSRR